MGKVIQILLDSQDNLIVLTEDGKIFARVEGKEAFHWSEIWLPGSTKDKK